MQKENTAKSRKHKLKVVISDDYNADDFKQGNTVLIEQGAEFKDGDICVLENTQTGKYCAVYLFHTDRRNSHGKPYKYRFTRYLSGRTHSGSSYLYGDERDSYTLLGKIVKSAAAQQAKKQASRATYKTAFEWSFFGVHYDDALIVEENGKARPGQLILVWNKKRDDSYFTRCCLVTDTSVRITNDTNETYDIDLNQVVGAVVEIKHDECNHTQIEALRQQIRSLEADEDATTNSTQIYKLEREILALENPPEDDTDDTFEWPEVIGEEGEL